MKKSEYMKPKAQAEADKKEWRRMQADKAKPKPIPIPTYVPGKKYLQSAKAGASKPSRRA